MGVDFIGHHGDLSLHWQAWSACFDLALAFGWQPAGTVACHEDTGPPKQWDGGYFTNDFQMVTGDDAKALAAALRRALTALRTKAHLTKQQIQACEGVNIKMICRLADHAERGGFAIY